MIRKINPTQLYLSLIAPNEKLFKKIANPVKGYGWNKFLKSLKELSKKKTRTVLRMTLIKGLNMIEPENYAQLIKMAKPWFVEVKSYMAVGFSRQRFGDPQCIKMMPRHPEVREFAAIIAKKIGYKIIDEKKNSRVVLLASKKGIKNKKIKFD
jgi:tRNA wybutosine-synthesizing protein 1